jgi:hypothetical protein
MTLLSSAPLLPLWMTAAGDGGPDGGSAEDGLSANVDLTIPLLTLLGLKEYPT